MAPVLDTLGNDGSVVLAVVVLFGGAIVGYVFGEALRRLLRTVGVADAVVGTSFERTAQSLGTSTVALFARLNSWFIYGVSILLSLQLLGIFATETFLLQIVFFLPDVFIALLALSAGFVVGDKAELTISERLKGLKLPEISVIPTFVKYTVVFLASLLALSQLGVATNALLVVFGAYVAAVIVFVALALRDVLPAAAAGAYLLLVQPIGIGDLVEIGDREGVVQEVSIFVINIESEEREYIVPNHLVLRTGIVRVRD